MPGTAVTRGAKADLTTAYTTAAGAGPTQSVPVELGGKTLQPGVYAGGELGLTGTLTLDGGNNPNAVFSFNAASTLITASNSQVKLININPCNVFWQVTSSATLGTGSEFVGTIMALTDVHLTTGATLSGRALARDGAVTLQANTISLPSCTQPTTTPTTSTTTKKPSTTPSTTKTTTTNRGVPSKTGAEEAVDPLAIGGLVVLVGLLISGALAFRHRREQ
jgi:hypothetical protein